MYRPSQNVTASQHVRFYQTHTSASVVREDSSAIAKAADTSKNPEFIDIQQDSPTSRISAVPVDNETTRKAAEAPKTRIRSAEVGTPKPEKRIVIDALHLSSPIEEITEDVYKKRITRAQTSANTPVNPDAKRRIGDLRDDESLPFINQETARTDQFEHLRCSSVVFVNRCHRRHLQ